VGASLDRGSASMTYYGALVSNRFDTRLRMVHVAEDRGISEAAREYETTPKTVRKWVKRYREQGLDGLADRSRAPKSVLTRSRGVGAADRGLAWETSQMGSGSISRGFFFALFAQDS